MICRGDPPIISSLHSCLSGVGLKSHICTLPDVQSKFPST